MIFRVAIAASKVIYSSALDVRKTRVNLCIFEEMVTVELLLFHGDSSISRTVLVNDWKISRKFLPCLSRPNHKDFMALVLQCRTDLNLALLTCLVVKVIMVRGKRRRKKEDGRRYSDLGKKTKTQSKDLRVVFFIY